MSPLTRFVPLTLFVVLVLQGCSNIAVLAALQPRYSASVETLAPPETLRAVRHALVALGWAPIADRSRGNRIVAVRDVTRSTRDVAIVEVGSQGQLDLWVRTELAGEDGHWIVPGTICDGYTFARERVIAARIETMAHRIARRLAARRNSGDARARSQQ
jgi:hypothetical protein